MEGKSITSERSRDGDFDLHQVALPEYSFEEAKMDDSDCLVTGAAMDRVPMTAAAKRANVSLTIVNAKKKGME